MSHASESTGPTRTSNTSNPRQTPLFRGTGCHHCRTRKVKCDAGKPHCSRCIQQGTTDRCKYDEVKKSKLTLVKEENAELKERIAQLERRLAGLSPPKLESLALEDAKPSSSTFSLTSLEADNDEEQDYEHDEAANDDARDDPINFGSGSYQQQPTHGVRPEHFPMGPALLPRLDPYPRPQHTVQSGSFDSGQPGHSGQYPLPCDQYQPAYQERYYSPTSASNYFSTPGFTQAGVHAQSASYTPRIQTGQLPEVYSTWPPTPSDQVPPSASTSNFTPSPVSNRWKPLPYLCSETAPRSPGSSYPNYPRGATFRNDGRYVGGAMPSYNAYQGAPIQAPMARRRPVPSPPVFGHDIVLSFFQRWKGEPPPDTYVQDQYTQAPADGSWALVGNWWERDDLSVANRNYLLELFLPYRKQVGLEIWVPGFLASLHLPPKRRPHPGFMWAIYSLAAFFSGIPELKELVPEFMERARRNLEESYAKSDRLFDYIRGQTLYASLLYMSGRGKQGAMATSSASHAAIVCGLHKISSPVMAPLAQHPEPSAYRIKPIEFQLEPATSPREHGERIAAFWQLILVDHSAAATTGLPAMFRDDEEYMNGEALNVPYATLSDIFTSRVIPNPPDIAVTLQVKATALLERAVRLATKWPHGKHISTTNPSKYYEEYNIVLLAIQHFKSYLPGLYPQEGNIVESQLPLTSRGLIWERLFPHYMTWNAEIQLYSMFEEEQVIAREECLRAAREIKNLTACLADGEIEMMGVLLTHCWNSARHALAREQKRCRERLDEVGVEFLQQDLNIVCHALEVLAANNQLTAIQADLTDQSRGFPLEYP
ncbi:hypothetical protein OPQ81_009386 [Rhizoctonia solani]|nr:hypothetical protein OPQ81_009386 [Rhizoctonia solani]